MPVWTCPKCGEKVENYAWGDAPWKSHKCAGRKPDFELPDPRAQREAQITQRKHKSGNLTDFF